MGNAQKQKEKARERAGEKAEEKTLERTMKALANRRRLAIVRHLKSEKEASVGDVSSAIKLSFKATSKHLGILAAAGIVDREQRSLQMFYRLAADCPRAARAILELL